VNETPEVVAVLTTFENGDDAARVVRALVERRLIACGNLVPGVRSIYRWQGQIEDSGEVLGVLKARRDRLDELTAVLTELHPYDVPEIVALPVVGGGLPYLSWVATEGGREPA
jgi:periplasmic divalent cation tolerance protein